MPIDLEKIRLKPEHLTNKEEHMFEFTAELLAEAEEDENAGSKWVRDPDWNNNDVVSFEITDAYRLEDVKDDQKRFHVKQEMKVLSGPNEGKNYSHTWWDVSGDKPNLKTRKFLTRALKGAGLKPSQMQDKNVDEVLQSSIGLRFQAKCTQKPKVNGNGFYTSWWDHEPV